MVFLETVYSYCSWRSWRFPILSFCRMFFRDLRNHEQSIYEYPFWWLHGLFCSQQSLQQGEMLKRDYSLIKNKKMKKNLGTIDKLVRILIAAVIAILFFANIITGALGIALLLFAVILVVTSFINFCPIYFAFGLSSNKKKS